MLAAWIAASLFAYQPDGLGRVANQGRKSSQFGAPGTPDKLFAAWKENHIPELNFLATTHSGSAKRLLGIDVKAKIDGDIDDETFANFFFLGEVELWRSIYDEYEK